MKLARFPAGCRVYLGSFVSTSTAGFPTSEIWEGKPQSDILLARGLYGRWMQQRLGKAEQTTAFMELIVSLSGVRQQAWPELRYEVRQVAQAPQLVSGLMGPGKLPASPLLGPLGRTDNVHAALLAQDT